MISVSANRIGAAALVVAVLTACLFGQLAAIGLTGPDEPRYASIARDMARSSDWVTPRLNGQPWFEKPILYYWVAAIFYRLLPGDEWPARMPSAFAALTAALALAWLAKKFYGAATAFAALLILPTCVGVVGFARAATPDMLFSSALTLAMAAAACTLTRAGAFRVRDASKAVNLSSRWHESVYGACLGLAVLAKGPAALVIAGGAAASWALAARNWRPAFRLASLTAILSCGAVALPWYVICAKRNPGFLHIFFVEHNFARYLTPEFQHRQPVWFFLPIIFIGLLPWSLVLCAPLARAHAAWRARQWREAPELFFVAWAVSPFLFFSFSQSKLPGYVLPCIGPLALLIAASVAAGNEITWRRAWLPAAVGGAWILLGGSYLIWKTKLPAGADSSAQEFALIAAASSVVAGLLIAWKLRRSPALVATSAIVSAVLLVCTSSLLLPHLDPFLSARSSASRAAPYEDRGELRTFELSRDWQYGLDYYLRREVPPWNPADSGGAVVCTSHQGLNQMILSGRTLHLEHSGESAQLVIVDPIATAH